MKYKLLFISLTLLFTTSCSIGLTGPYTGTSYRMGIEKERGLYIQAKPPLWDTASDIGHEIMTAITDEEEEDK